MEKVTSALALLFLLAFPAVAQESKPEVLPRYLPAVWIGVDLHSRRLMENLTDPGMVVRIWSLGSHVQGAENVFGAVVGARTMGVGWVWRLQDGRFYAGLAAVVETSTMFDEAKPVKVRPAVTLSFKGGGKE